MRGLKPFLVVTDVGFIVYWFAVALELIPRGHLFEDYADPILTAWNWSFFPLDMLVSATGLTGLYLHGAGHPAWRGFVLVSLTLTVCAGLQAVTFWAVRGDFDPAWWLPNLFLLAYPMFFIPRLIVGPKASG